MSCYFLTLTHTHTHTHTLTHTQFSVLEEDLTHYRDQPDRLIEEFKKLKTAKRKAEQFAIEAKQSAQKVTILFALLLAHYFREIPHSW